MQIIHYRWIRAECEQAEGQYSERYKLASSESLFVFESKLRINIFTWIEIEEERNECVILPEKIQRLSRKIQWFVKDNTERWVRDQIESYWGEVLELTEDFE